MINQNLGKDFIDNRTETDRPELREAPWFIYFRNQDNIGSSKKVVNGFP